MVSQEARGFIARKIMKNLREGYHPKQAQAIAYSQARAEGYKVPPPVHVSRAERGK